jgi:RNA 3'-phosphate cyclase
MSNGKAEGLSIGSTDITFIPGEIKGGDYVIDIKTAGAITLILQTLVPIGIYADSPSLLEIKGGTAVPFSPSIEYFRQIFCYFLGLMGVTISVDVKRHGFYPRGGGICNVKVFPAKLKPIKLTERGNLIKVNIISISSSILAPSKVGERMIEGAKEIFPEATSGLYYVDSPGAGCFIHTDARFTNSIIGADGLGRKGKKAEAVGMESGKALEKDIKRGVLLDRWMTDQIIPYFALAAYETGKKAKIRIPELTRHAQTNIWVIKHFLSVDFRLEEDILECWISQ